MPIIIQGIHPYILLMFYCLNNITNLINIYKYTSPGKNTGFSIIILLYVKLQFFSTMLTCI